MPLIQTQITDMWDSCFESPKTIKEIAEFLKVPYMTVYNFLKTHAGKIYFMLAREDSYLWIRSNPQAQPGKALNLISDKQPPKETKNASGEDCGLEGLRRAAPERWKAVQKTLRCKGYGYTDEETGDFIYTNSIKQECIQLFKDYISRIRQENIVIAHSLNGDPVFSRDLDLPYKTRFTDPGRQAAIRNGFQWTWNNASNKHAQAVFLTLTASPHKCANLWETNRAMLKAWDNFRSFLDYKLPKKLTYICVREFQENGRLHFHIVFFGINWLLHEKVIKYKWQQYGGGPIMDVCTIRQTAADGWQWSRRCPREAAGQAPKSFLESYLEKSMNPLSGVNYWLFNVQYWTASENIKIATQPRQEKKHKGVFSLKGVKSKITGWRASHRSDSNAFFSGALLRVCKKSEPKPKGKPKEKK